MVIAFKPRQGQVSDGGGRKGVKGRKRGATGSVENLDDHENHDVVGEGEQAEVAALAVIGAAADMSALATFDHRDHGFDLRAAAVGGAIEPDLHESTVTAGR